MSAGVHGRVIGPRHIGYARAASLLQPGEELYAVHDQGIKHVAVPLPDEEAWKLTGQQYGTGLSLDYFFAAVPAEEDEVTMASERRWAATVMRDPHLLLVLIGVAMELHEPGEGGGEYTRGQAELIAGACGITTGTARDALMPLLYSGATPEQARAAVLAREKEACHDQARC